MNSLLKTISSYAQKPPFTLNLIEMPFDTFTNRAEPDQAALVRAA